MTIFFRFSALVCFLFTLLPAFGVQMTQYSGLWRTCSTNMANGASCDRWSDTNVAACAAMVGKHLFGDSGTSVVTSSIASGASCSGTMTGNYGYYQNLATHIIDYDVCAPQIDQVTISNVTAGYSRSVAGAGLYPPVMPDGSAAASGYMGLPPSSMCIAGCLQARGAAVASWTSLEPTATGLYRQSDDWSFTNLGTSCTATPAENAAANPAANVPACVGFVGQVNGKLTCIPSVPDSGIGPGAKPKSATVGNPTASTPGGVGNIPATGGNGANAGGPKGSSDGGVVPGGGGAAVAPPTPAASAPKGFASAPGTGLEQVACGAPGQPKCAIDGTGIPSAADPSIAKSADGYKKDMDSLRGTVAGSGDKNFFNGGWSTLFSAPAIAACTPIAFPADLGSVDPCPVVEGVRSVMGYIWALTAMFMCLGMIKRVI